MVDRPAVGIASPARPGENTGNAQTAARWARFLAPLAEVSVFEHWDGRPLQALVALHARKSADSVAAFRQAFPRRPVVLVLTGTDLYRDLPGDPDARRSLALADRLVVLQARALDALPADVRGKAVVIEQSAEAPATVAAPGAALATRAVGRAPGDPAHFIAIGHLREVKDPLTLVRAARRLAGDPRVHVDHLGAALEPALRDEMLRLSPGEPTWRWLGARPHDETLARLAAADALVHPSLLEGGANVVIEAVRAGVPVLASAIDGNLGLLGDDYPGVFPPGDDEALAALMRRFMDDPAFAASLRQRGDAVARRFEPSREAAQVRTLVADALGRPPDDAGRDAC